MINLMKTRNIYSLLYVTFVAVALVACNDYDAAQTAYEEIVDSDVTTTPPNIDSYVSIVVRFLFIKTKSMISYLLAHWDGMVELVCNLHHCLMEMFYGLLMIAILEL